MLKDAESALEFIKAAKNHPSYKHGKTLVEVFCLDCPKKLGKKAFLYGTIRCSSCAGIQNGKKFNGKNSSNYKEGRTLVVLYCSDCPKKLGKLAFYNGSTRCASCSAKLRIENTPWIGAKGSDNHAWKGGISTLTNLIRNCQQYKEWRTACFIRDEYTCRHCDEIGGKLHVDHIKSFADIFNLFLKKYSEYNLIKDKDILLRLAIKHKPFWNLKNGRTLCVPCHEKTPNYKNKKIK